MKTYSILLLFLCTGVFSPGLASAQNTIKVYKASYVNDVDVSPEAERALRRRDELLDKKNLSAAEQKELDKLLVNFNEGIEDLWSVESIGCSWYCGGGNYKVSASSVLSAGNGLDYSAESANDLSYKTAWVEGKSDEGLGEYLEYSFKNNSPRITSIIITNGYIKSKETWKNNNRVKTLRLYINGKPFGLLELEDIYGDHVFELGTFGHNKDGSDLVLRFEIVAVFKGEKYNDTAITEIYFDGIDVH